MNPTSNAPTVKYFYAYTRTETVLRSTTQLLNTGYNINIIVIYIRSTIIMLNNYIAHHFYNTVPIYLLYLLDTLVKHAGRAKNTQLV